MATKFDKKKLIEDNSDLYISDYDKNLDYSYLSDIIGQKRAYTQAQKSGDSSGMKKANDRANSIRTQAASYTAGSDGSAYTRVKRPYEVNRPKMTNPYYSKERDRVYDSIASFGDFNYNINSDPLYKTYREIYTSLGNDAYERALGENSLRTGGTASTSAVSAAQLARNKYNSELANIVPKLYEMAYSRHKDRQKSLYDRLNAINDIDKTEYSRYRDDVKDYENDRDYYYEKDSEIADLLYKTGKDDTDLGYDIMRDKKDDEFREKEHSDEMKYKEKTHKDEMEYKEKKLRQDDENDKIALSVNLAKALYGKKPISANTISYLLSLVN